MKRIRGFHDYRKDKRGAEPLAGARMCPVNSESPANGHRLGWAFALTACFMVAEIIGGLISGSVALLADAAHMFTDTAALGMALAAWRFAQRPADAGHSYGHRRIQVIAALINALALIVLVGWLAIEAISRLSTPRPVDAGIMLVVAVLGGLVNIAAALILRRGRDSDLNVSVAYLHVLSDLAGSLAAMVAAIVILTTGWLAVDPLLALLIAALVARVAWRMLSRAVHILLEGVPEGFDPVAMAVELSAAVSGISNIHHVHAWSVGSEEPIVTFHARLQDGADGDRVLADLKRELQQRYNIHHSTIQLEHGPCRDPA